MQASSRMHTCLLFIELMLPAVSLFLLLEIFPLASLEFPLNIARLGSEELYSFLFQDFANLPLITL